MRSSDLESFENSILEVKESRNGVGIFSKVDLKADQSVYQVTGKLFPLVVIDSMTGPFADNCFRYSEDLYLSPDGEIGDSQNHSCVPNSRVVKKEDALWIEAIRNIKEGEEV